MPLGIFRKPPHAGCQNPSPFSIEGSRAAWGAWAPLVSLVSFGILWGPFVGPWGPWGPGGPWILGVLDWGLGVCPSGPWGWGPLGSFGVLWGPRWEMSGLGRAKCKDPSAPD